MAGREGQHWCGTQRPIREGALPLTSSHLRPSVTNLVFGIIRQSPEGPLASASRLFFLVPTGVPQFKPHDLLRGLEK